MVQRVAIAPPQSRIGPLSEPERAALIARSGLGRRYDKPFDRESAYEMLSARARRTSSRSVKLQTSLVARRTRLAVNW